MVFKLQVWTLALSFSIAALFQAILLLILVNKRLPDLVNRKMSLSFLKIGVASSISGSLIFFLLKVLDRSAWDKNLSFLRWVGLKLPTSFQYFVLDTRYTLNLILLTVLVALIGLLVYLLIAWLLKVEEMSILKKLMVKIKILKPLSETITPPPE